MHIEAFTCGKNPADPAANEDRLIVYSDCAFGVIDGVTDKSGLRVGGRTGGQMAGLVIERALRALVDGGEAMTLGAEQIVERIEAEFGRSYRDHGLVDAVTADPNRRFAAQLALALTDGHALRLLQIGDCGIRLNGATTLVASHPADGIMAAIRATIYRHLEREGAADADACLASARAYIVAGLGAYLPDEIPSRETWERLRSDLRASLPGAFADLDADLVRHVADIGLRGVASFRNREGPLGYGCLDGFPVPGAFITLQERSLEHVHTVELFSDGYFGLPAGTTLADWEAHIARIERDDPAKIDTIPSTKGSSPGRFTDDRSILILRKDPPRHAQA